MEMAFRDGIVAVLLLNLISVVLLASGFAGVIFAFRRVPGRIKSVFDRCLLIWLGAMIALGVFVAVNNLFVLLIGQSIL